MKWMQHVRTGIGLVALALVGLTACGPSAPAQSSNVIVDAADYSFTAPDQIAAGPTRLQFRNLGQEPHHAQLARLNDGVTFEQLTAAVQQRPEAAFPLVSFVGGPATIDPTGSASVTLDLQVGQYAWLCFLPSSDGVRHLAKGMVRPLTVTASGQAQGTLPQADLSIALHDFHYTMPAEITAGAQVWEIRNDGPQPHELVILKLAPGATPADVTAFLAQPNGPPPFTSVGGMQGLQAGLEGYINLNLEPGSYLALCDIPDPQSGKPHAALGMVMPFTVN